MSRDFKRRESVVDFETTGGSEDNVKSESEVVVNKTPKPEEKSIVQKLTFKEFHLRNKNTLNIGLLGAVQFLHGKERLSNEEWCNVYDQVSKQIVTQ